MAIHGQKHVPLANTLTSTKPSTGNKSRHENFILLAPALLLLLGDAQTEGNTNSMRITKIFLSHRLLSHGMHDICLRLRIDPLSRPTLDVSPISRLFNCTHFPRFRNRKVPEVWNPNNMIHFWGRQAGPPGGHG